MATHQGSHANLPPRPRVLAARTHRNTRMYRFIILFRILEITLASVHLACLVYAATHKGWWADIQNPLILGGQLPYPHRLIRTTDIREVAASVAAYLSAFYTAMQRCRFTDRAVYQWPFACLIDATIMGLWSATFVLMCLPKGKDFRHLFETPSYYTWAVAAVCAFGSAITYACSAKFAISDR